MKNIVFNCFIFLLFLCIAKNSLGQAGGNQLFDSNTKERELRIPENRLYLNDSSFLIEANVLKNVLPETYIAVFGVTQSSKNVKSCNSISAARVSSFVKNLRNEGIPETDIYTDFVNQYRVYDLKSANNQYFEEYLKGFDLNKNVIVKLSKSEQIEKMLVIASQDSIFDLVKVDCFVNDITSIYDELFVAAQEIILKKKKLYLGLTGMVLLPQAQIFSESFSSFYPSQLYDKYEAFEGTSVDYNYYERSKSIVRKPKIQSFYYNPMSYSTFDKVINPIIIEPAIQFLLKIRVRYSIAMPKK